MRLRSSDAAGDRRAALSAIREARGALQLRAQLSGALREHLEVHQEEREFIASWGTPHGTLGSVAPDSSAGVAVTRERAGDR